MLLAVITLPLITTHNGDGKFQNSGGDFLEGELFFVRSM